MVIDVGHAALVHEFELDRVFVPAAALLARARDLAQRLDRLGVLAVGQIERLRQQAELGRKSRLPTNVKFCQGSFYHFSGCIF